MTGSSTDAGDESPTAISRRRLLQGTAAASLLSTLPTGASADGRTEVIVRAAEVDVPLVASSSSVVDELRAAAAESQEPVVEYVESTDGLAVKNRFWLANALLVEVDTSVVDLGELATREGIVEVHPNYSFEIPEPEAATASAADADVTYGLDQIDAPEAWDTYDARGQGARIAVLDTGVDPDHPDVDVAPENFAEFDSDGNEVDSEPHDSAYHGTHVSGTVVGGDDSGTAIGVAPEAELLHGLVIPGGGGSFVQIIAGMEWAVENDADAINMSLGSPGYSSQLIEPVRNAEAAGTVVVAAAGNDGANTSGTPGNVYDSFAIGASDEAEEIASFSGGETIDTADAWGSQAPDDWPDSYVVPDASAPGVDVLSSYPVDHSDGPYNAISGTSMASPHVAGLVGLVESAGAEDVEPEQVKAALTATAWKPDGEPDESDTRYGHGIVDAVAAVGRVAADSGVTGTITDADGNPVEGARVELDGFPTETDANGEYRLRAASGTYELSVDAFGHADETVTVEVADGFLTRDFALADDLAVTTVTDQPDGLEAGESFDVEIQVANAETLTVDRVGDYEGDAWLSVNGGEATFGEPFPFDGGISGVVTLTVDTGEDGVGDLELELTLDGMGETVSVGTGPTSVYAESTPVAIVEAGSGGYASTISAILDGEMHPRYHFAVLEPAAALEAARNRDHEAYVVQSLGDDEDLVAAFADVATAPEVGVVYLDQYGDASNAVSRLSDVAGDPGDTFDALVELGAPPVDYEVGRDHPALDGIAEAGDSVTITEPDPVSVGPGLFVGGFHTYFEDYRGPVAGATLAETAVGFTASGEGLAVDDLSRTVLASSLGLGPLVDRSMFTADGTALLASLVAHAADTPPIAVVETPAERVAPGGSVTAEIEVSDLLEVEIDVSGLEFLGESDLTLSVDGERVPFGEPVSYEEHTGTVEVAVETAANAIGEFALDTRFVTLGDRDQEVETAATLGATTVYESPIRVPDQLGDLQAAVDFVRPGDAVEIAGGTYALDADRGVQTGLYVGTPAVTIRGVEGATVEIVHARDLPAPNVVNVDADGVTIENLSANVIDGAIDPKNGIGQGIRINELVSGTTIRDVTAAGTTGVFLDTDASDVHVEGATVVESSVGVGTDLAGGPVADVTVTDLTFENPYFFGWGGVYLENATRATVTDCEITYATGYDAGVFVFGDFSGSEDNLVARNAITGPDDDDPFTDTDNGVYVDGAEVEIRDNEIVDTYVGIRVGELGVGTDPPSVFVEDNVVENATTGFVQFGDAVSLERNAFEADVGLHFDGGYFGLEADAVVARYNDLSKADVPLKGVPSDGYGDPEGPFGARLNYLGDRGYGEAIADGEVAYDPFLTVPPGEAESLPPTEIATDLTLEPGNAYGLGVPGPTDRTIYEILGVDGFRDFAGDLEFWNENSGKFQRVTGEGDLKYVDALSAFRVTPSEGVRAVVDFRTRADTPPGHHESDPATTGLQQGWNFVAAPRYGDESEVFGVEAIEEVRDELHSPGGQVGEGGKEAFSGYKVRASEDVQLTTGLDVYDPTMTELYESLGLDPAIHDEPGPGATTSGETPTVADVLDAVPEAEAADAVATLVRHRIGREAAAADNPEAAAEAVESAATAAVEEAPTGRRDLVEEATARAATEAVRAAFGAAAVGESDDDYDTRAARAAAEEGDATSTSLGVLPSAISD